MQSAILYGIEQGSAINLLHAFFFKSGLEKMRCQVLVTAAKYLGIDINGRNVIDSVLYLRGSRHIDVIDAPNFEYAQVAVLYSRSFRQ